MIKVSTNIDSFIKTTGASIKKQIEFAKRLANTRTAIVVRDIEIDEMKKVFDRPTPFALRGVEYVADRKGYEPGAKVKLREEAGKGIPAVKFLFAEVYGGKRALKSTEKKLIAKGIMPSNCIIVPGRGAKLDRYGNISNGLLIQIASILQLFDTIGSEHNATPKSLKRNKELAMLKQNLFIINKPNRLHMGIYSRDSAGRLKMLIAFVPKQNYKEKFKFFDVGIKAAPRIYAMQYPNALMDAIKTAKLK